nr:calcium-transporting ATPase 4, plasma membrane-type-like isoform X2 [Tanacetum cinerariifolium]
KIRIALYVQKAALQFIDAANRTEHKLSQEVAQAGFDIELEDLAYIVRSHNNKTYDFHGGLQGLVRKIKVSLRDGVLSGDLSKRQQIFGCNRFVEKPSRPLWMFVWDALQDMTLIILMVCAVISVGVGIATEGWPKGMYDGLGIILCILLVVVVTAVSDYKQSLQFKDLDKEKKNIIIQVTRDGTRKKVSIYDLVVGDIVHLSIGDQVPADGIFIDGYSLSIDESSLSGESEPVNVDKKRPFLLSGTKVQDGSGKMLVTSVGMKTEWGRLMVTLSEGGDDETPLQVKLNGVATIIGKIGLAFAVLTFFVLTARFILMKVIRNEMDKALVRHLSACETMGSATCICTDKTGTLTTNHMDVTRLWVAGETKEIKSKEKLRSTITEKVLAVLLQSVFLNTNSEIVKDETGKTNIIGSLTETALLESGLLFQSNYNQESKSVKIVKVEPFNSVKKKIQRKAITDVINGFACDALRTICLAFQDLEAGSSSDDIPENNYTIIAVVGIKDPVRPGVKEAVKTCLDAGIMVRMVTGDNINTAKAIARECGILTPDGLAIEGPEEVVAVTGDGTNDAPALHEADIGLAMGIAGTEVAKENADFVIMDDNFKTILTVNVVALMTNFVSACTSGSAPLTAVQLLWVNMIMDTLGALALATEPPNDALMKIPPIDGKSILNINGPGSTDVLNTMIFNTFVFCQVFNEINSRDMEKINVLQGTFASTVPLSWNLWFASVLMGAISLPVGALLKCIPVKSSTDVGVIKQHDG